MVNKGDIIMADKKPRVLKKDKISKEMLDNMTEGEVLQAIKDNKLFDNDSLEALSDDWPLCIVGDYSIIKLINTVICVEYVTRGKSRGLTQPYIVDVVYPRRITSKFKEMLLCL